MRIIFFRHGIAQDGGRGMSDAQRPLTDEGIAKTTHIAAHLAKLIDQPAVLLTSPKLRAVQTADLLGKQMHVQPQVVDALGVGSAKAILDVLSKRDEPNVVVVGHEPDLSEAVEMLLTGQTLGRLELKKAGAACVQTTGPIRAGRACGNLMWLTTPGMWNS